jgi:glyoxylase-like metal-dependent hydrolase (beta-lactamase superfamily II)
MSRLLRSFTLLVLLASLASLVIVVGAQPPVQAQADPPELAYLKQVNEWRPPDDPQLLFLLMGQFANAGRHAQGIAFFEDRLARFGPALSDGQRAQYLVAIAALRATHAGEVFLPRRIGWVRDTLARLDEAKRLTRGQAFIVRWMSGVVRAQLPGFFGERDAALADLQWCVQHVAAAPHPGWLREVYAQLAAVYEQRGDAAQARHYQALGGFSGFASGPHPALFTTPFAEDAAAGHTFSARTIREAVPGTVYVLSGFEFTEYYFIVSADRRELIAIDAGTRPDAARAAHEALRARVPSLPPLTTVFVTHAHWDHVGGHRYLRGLDPAPRFYGRGSYKEELAHDAMANPAMLRRFFGERFRLDDVLGYQPDVSVDKPTPLVVGGTRFELLPTRGGETGDALLVHMPDQGVLFVGDILMPYLGAPFAAEGSVDGLLDAIDQVHALQPQLLLHGHEPLTRLFPSTAMLDGLRPQLAWLRDEVLREMKSGAERGAIQQANLVPPTLSRGSSQVHLAYLVLREHVINRLFEQNSGYWQNGLRGLDALTDADHGAALVEYLHLSDTQLAVAAERMIGDGRHELAVDLLRAAHTRFPDDARLNAVRRLAYLKLMEKAQEFDPFKFIVYGSQIDQPVPRVDAPPAAAAAAH